MVLSSYEDLSSIPCVRLWRSGIIDTGYGRLFAEPLAKKTCSTRHEFLQPLCPHTASCKHPLGLLILCVPASVSHSRTEFWICLPCLSVYVWVLFTATGPAFALVSMNMTPFSSNRSAQLCRQALPTKLCALAFSSPSSVETCRRSAKSVLRHPAQLVAILRLLSQ